MVDERLKEKIADELGDSGKNVIRKLGLRRMVKFQKIMTALYNKLCIDCKRVLIAEPSAARQGVDVFCERCKENVKPELDQLHKLHEAIA